jgi:hypothetical protein
MFARLYHVLHLSHFGRSLPGNPAIALPRAPTVIHVGGIVLNGGRFAPRREESKTRESDNENRC